MGWSPLTDRWDHTITRAEYYRHREADEKRRAAKEKEKQEADECDTP